MNTRSMTKRSAGPEILNIPTTISSNESKNRKSDMQPPEIPIELKWNIAQFSKHVGMTDEGKNGVWYESHKIEHEGLKWYVVFTPSKNCPFEPDPDKRMFKCSLKVRNETSSSLKVSYWITLTGYYHCLTTMNAPNQVTLGGGLYSLSLGVGTKKTKEVIVWWEKPIHIYTSETETYLSAKITGSAQKF